MLSLPQKLYTINIKQQTKGVNPEYRKYFTSSLNDKQCIFSFKEHSVATDCTVFLAHYKNKFHEYPVIDNSNVLKIDSYEKIYEFNTEFYSSFPPEIIEDAFINYLTLNNL